MIPILLVGTAYIIGKTMEGKTFEEGGKIGTIKIDGKEATQDELIDILRDENTRWGSFNFNPKKIEYNGNDAQLIQSINSYNRTTNPYTNGKLKDNYMVAIIQDAFIKFSFRKFGDAFRKNIGKYFSAENNSVNLTGGRRWKDYASYVIGDGSFYIKEENDFRGFAKDLGITIPPNKS